jgi:hypothetical protein
MRPRYRRLAGSALIILTLSSMSCASSPSESVASSPFQIDPTSASSGVCTARLALPDVAAAGRAFTDLAHEGLHRLAADSRLSRSKAAGILEAMERSEADLSDSPSAADLAPDLDALQIATDEALKALGQVVPACAR